MGVVRARWEGGGVSDAMLGGGVQDLVGYLMQQPWKMICLVEGRREEGLALPMGYIMQLPWIVVY